MSNTAANKKIGKVLIVDDSARFRRAIRKTLEGLAEEIIEAADGQSAITAYLTHRPDWVTMDLEMGPMDGLTALRTIKACDPHARILVVTVHNARSFAEGARQAGASGFVPKEDLRMILGFLNPASPSHAPSALLPPVL